MRAIPNRVIAAMRADRAEGVPWMDLCAAHNVALATAQKYAGDVPPPEGGWSKGGRLPTFDRAKARKLREQGLTYRVIAERFGVSKRTVERAIHGRRVAA